MALETKLYQKLSQQLVMTPQLRQAIKILQVSRMELESMVSEELLENPTLDEVPEDAQIAEARKEEPDPAFDGVVAESAPEVAAVDAQAESKDASQLDEINWQDYYENYNNDSHGSMPGSGGGGGSAEDDERRPLENVLTKQLELTEHLMWQLKLSPLSEEWKTIGELVIGNLDGDGYLRTPLDEVANLAGASLEETEAVLQELQKFDPPGVCARDLRECLLIQLALEGETESIPAVIVRDHLAALETRRFDKLAKVMDLDVDDIVWAAERIARLEPKPGRDYGGGDARHVMPDVYVSKVGEEYVVTLNDDGLPRLRVSKAYLRMLSDGTAPDAKGYVQEKMRSAAWLIKSIQQRQRTMFLVTTSIVNFQIEFFERGIAGLRPLVLKDVAADIGMHESTVSRATSNKYVHTPQGTYELKFFFTSSLRGDGGEDVSAESVKQRIRDLVAEENGKKPLSDQQLANLLGEEGVDIARRTVAKYRELLKIPPSSKRKQIF